jgi:hypothetical protein
MPKTKSTDEQPTDEQPNELAVPTTSTKDYLGTPLINATPGTSDAKDHLGRDVQTGNRDYLGRALVA